MAYQIGVATGVIFGLLILFVMAKRRGGKETRYDERQMAVRGACYEKGFFTTLILSMLVIVLDTLHLPYWNCALAITAALFGGIGVFAWSAIMHDAYLGLNMRRRSCELTFGVVAVCQTVSVLSMIGNRSFLTEEGILSYSWICALCAALFYALLAAFLVKSAMEKREEEEMDDVL